MKHLLERYVYLDILRNPPQTSGNSFEQIDLISELNNYVCSIDNNLYDFYRKIKKIIDKAKDLHLNFEFNINHKFQAINSYFLFLLHHLRYLEEKFMLLQVNIYLILIII